MCPTPLQTQNKSFKFTRIFHTTFSGSPGCRIPEGIQRQGPPQAKAGPPPPPSQNPVATEAQNVPWCGSKRKPAWCESKLPRGSLHRRLFFNNFIKHGLNFSVSPTPGSIIFEMVKKIFVIIFANTFTNASTYTT